LVAALGKKAGFTQIKVSPDLQQFEIQDKKDYFDKNNDARNIIDIKKVVLTEKGLSTGQLQRLLVLRALIQFKTGSVLFGDEFLVNFSFLEGNKVLEGILDAFEETNASTDASKPKLAAFIFHDLSYPCIKKITEKRLNLKAKVMLLSEIGKENNRSIIGVQTIPMKDFWAADLPETSPFFNFRKNYHSEPEQGDIKNDMAATAKKQCGKLIFRKTTYESYAYPKEKECVYEKLYFEFKENRFIVLNGFSGCGKSTFCKQLVESYIPHEEKWTYRYFPPRTQESLSFGSQTLIGEDLQAIYSFYNGIEDILSPESAKEIVKHFQKVLLFNQGSNFKDYNDYENFLKKPVYSLSGGELQRYWFARITFFDILPEGMEKPKLLIFDESISSLDCETKDGLLKFIIQDLFLKEGLSVLFITHDLRDIGVLYKEIPAAKRAVSFEQYELFDKKMFWVKTPYLQYWNNIVHGGFNEYEENGKTTASYFYTLKEQEK
jgi:ABC-type dipeptide/oligopeptide/nickel transport system ATPase subunit